MKYKAAFDSAGYRIREPQALLSSPILPMASQTQRGPVTSPEPGVYTLISPLEKPDFLPHSNVTNTANAILLAAFSRRNLSE